MTQAERRATVTPPNTYHLGHPQTEKEKGRGTLQTSGRGERFTSRTHGDWVLLTGMSHAGGNNGAVAGWRWPTRDSRKP